MMHLRFGDGIEARSQINQYKRRDVFVCHQEGHKRFDYRVSAYHVLKEKGCYPHGCVSFVWKCARFNKGLSCLRGFRRVGRMCFGCRFFVDEKINHRPELVLSAERFKVFKTELRAFETWLEDLRGREVNFSGTVFSVKPNVTADPFRKWRLSFHGFLVVFREGFVNLDHLADFCYLRVSGRAQEKYRFRPGDGLDFYGRFTENRGRIILTRMNRVEIERGGEEFWWSEGRAQVALRTGALVEGQPEKCLNCAKGLLVDARERSGLDVTFRRRLFCLEGVRDPALCTPVTVKMREEIWDECCIHKDGSSVKGGLRIRSNVRIDGAALAR